MTWPDLLTDNKTGVTYYLARVGVTAEGYKKLGKRQLQSGHAGGGDFPHRRALHADLPVEPVIAPEEQECISRHPGRRNEPVANRAGGS